jgi:hypothetical protein
MVKSYRQRKLERTAFHEASHAVAGVIAGVEFTRVCLTSENKVRDSRGMIVQGYVKMRQPPDWVFPWNWNTNQDVKRAREYFRSNICMTLAGPLGETLFTGVWQQETRGEDSDEALAMHTADIARDSGAYPSWTPKDSRDYVNRLRFQMLETLRAVDVWAAISVVARELLKHKTLTGAKVHALVKRKGTSERGPCGQRSRSLAGIRFPGPTPQAVARGRRGPVSGAQLRLRAC